MNARDEIKNDIKNTISKGMRLGIIINPRLSSKNDEWNISSKYTFFKNEDDYCSRFHHVYEEGDYAFALSDGSFFQINYEFAQFRKRDVFVKKHNLCFLPGIDPFTKKPIHCYLRLDYDSEENNSFFHPQAHLHIGLGNDLRIPVNKILKLSDFFEFVLFLFYNSNLSDWNKQLIIGHTVSDVTGEMTKKQILADELENYFYLHQKE